MTSTNGYYVSIDFSVLTNFGIPSVRLGKFTNGQVYSNIPLLLTLSLENHGVSNRRQLACLFNSFSVIETKETS